MRSAGRSSPHQALLATLPRDRQDREITQNPWKPRTLAGEPRCVILDHIEGSACDRFLNCFIFLSAILVVNRQKRVFRQTPPEFWALTGWVLRDLTFFFAR